MAKRAVEVQDGIVQGKECLSCDDVKYYSFEGIPYAKPPVGELRFRDPQPPLKWPGIRDATKPGNRCIQLNPYAPGEINGSEDCLYLNVYTPSLPVETLEKLPVLFFIHGGRLIVGYGDYYRPDYLIKNNVILVTINYRLHILGFLSLRTQEVPGNAGLKDTIMALKWVNKNITYFNGDENNITVFGESAGSGIASSYLTTDMANGLFHKLILQSGISISNLYMDSYDPVDKAKTVANLMGKKISNEKELYDELKDANIDDLLMAYAEAETSRPPAEIQAFFLPVVEKRFEGVEPFFTEYPFVSMKRNKVKKVPIIVGYMSHEGALFANSDDEGNIYYEEDLQFFIPNYLFLKHNSEPSLKMAKQISEFYFKGKKIDDSLKSEYINLTTDSYFMKDIMLAVDMLAKHNKEIYNFRFSYSGNLNTRVMKRLGVKGASHGDMVQYQFYREQKHGIRSSTDQLRVLQLSDTWTTFAKTGKPTWSDQNIKWLPYRQNQRNTLVIDDKISLGQNCDWDRFAFWKNLVVNRSKL